MERDRGCGGGCMKRGRGGEGARERAREMDGAGGYCLTGIGIDRPRDAMERVAEGCWSMLRDVKSTPPTLTLPGYFFPASLNGGRRVLVARVVHRHRGGGGWFNVRDVYVNVRRTCEFSRKNNFLLDAEERRSCQIRNHS